jgi:hypothetical protein
LEERWTEPGGSPPLITDSFASTEVSQDDILKIYLEANDPDGDMRKFVYTIGEAGVVLALIWRNEGI